ncbi:hypothetical protein FACS189442_0490 [Spirochaetia bacterium]|nr:hypothetical protein FACS189442_0490 [Spirochaetia bacterium]
MDLNTYLAKLIVSAALYELRFGNMAVASRSYIEKQKAALFGVNS